MITIRTLLEAGVDPDRPLLLLSSDAISAVPLRLMSRTPSVGTVLTKDYAGDPVDLIDADGNWV